MKTLVIYFSILPSLLILSTSLGLFSAHAQENVQANIQEAKIENPKKTKGLDEADQIITNPRLRASEGSLSAWSISSSLNYSAGPLDSPFSPTRPNINGASDVALLQNLSGEIGVIHRFTKTDRIGLKTGLQMAAPFHQTIDSGDTRVVDEFHRTQGKLDFQNPALTYSKIFKLSRVQNVAKFTGGKYTQSALTNRGHQYSAEASINSMYAINNSGLSVGGLLSVSKNFFNADTTTDSKGRTKSLRDRQAEMIFALYPQLEYTFNDTFNFRTVVRAWVYEERRDRKFDKLIKRNLTQSVGIGISLTRDFFLYPNIQFAPDRLQSKNTNIGLSANINLF
jgi:hypothetical protein